MPKCSFTNIMHLEPFSQTFGDPTHVWSGTVINVGSHKKIENEAPLTSVSNWETLFDWSAKELVLSWRALILNHRHRKVHLKLVFEVPKQGCHLFSGGSK